jgi:diguanylate cyclase (GGDEF)-like protein/PAS domain S-box-containing protein
MMDIANTTHDASGNGGSDDAASGPPLTEREERFRTLVEHIPGVATYLDRVIVEDPEHSIPLYISPQVEEMFGYLLEEWLGEGELWVQILHPDDRARMLASDLEARRSLAPMSAEYRLLAKDGRVVWVSEKSAVVRDVVTGTLYWQGVMVDITERKTAEEALQASELKFRTLFDAAAIGVFTLDLSGRIREANTTIEWVGGYRSGDLNGRTLVALLHPDDEQAAQDLAELRAGNRDRAHVEHRFMRRDGSYFWCRTVVSLVRGADRRPLYAMGMIEDVSERKALEDELVERAVHDHLTGLPNRRLLEDRLRTAIASTARRQDAGVAVIFADLDDFKPVNDDLGHSAGDDLLIAVAERLAAAVRPSDTVARYGGDEFVIVANEVTSSDMAHELAGRLATVLKDPFVIAGRKLLITASFGVAASQDPDERPEDLIRAADAAMYRAKGAGRDRIMGSPAA